VVIKKDATPHLTRYLALTILGCMAFSSVNAADDVSIKSIEVIQIFGKKNSLKTATGSGHVLTEEALEQFEFDDIHRVLQSVPGVYIREEDGYGLRPNIGLRGATSERSSKIALMEDGILLSPAPYSAPAAYFFPIVSRMTQVEVLKGPAAIIYGPNTVGGAINMVSRSISEDYNGQVDFAAGQQDYRKFHAFYSGTSQELGFLIEGINLHSDGFKELQNGDSTGFAKNELIGKLKYTPSDSHYKQSFELKVGYSDEVSNETYLGITDADFRANPYLRYPASQNDKFDWEHFQIQASHYVELNSKTTLFTQVYRRDFSRDWDRLNAFAGNRTIETVLRSPDTGLNSLFYAVLSGQRDSLTDDEALQFTVNDRTFLSQGVQSKIYWDLELYGIDMTVEAGVRVHQDQVERLHRARLFNLVSGELVFSGRPESVLTENKDKTTAIAGYLNSKFYIDDLTLSAGVRVEKIDGKAQDFLLQTTFSNDDTVILPGIGAFYQLNDNVGILFGVNKGFVPNSPGQADSIEPEESWNFEFGLRSNYADWQFETVGFYSDYSNLKGTCTFSSGCTTALNQEFNGGQVDIYGAELSASGDISFDNGLSLPISFAYTYTQSEFQNTFQSDFSQWGSVSNGDELPYLPEHQLSIQISLQAEKWEFAASFKFVSEMLESSGAGTELTGVSTVSNDQLDLSAWYQYNQQMKLYLKLDNATDEAQIVSRRPFGARPGKPRQVIAGVKYRF
jgi:Fe(3+) dicitrate transport protein